jgi:hypothetical protein
MHSLIFILTDENPEIRLFMINQKVRRMLGLEFQLSTSGLEQYNLGDANDTVLIRAIFEQLTD